MLPHLEARLPKIEVGEVFRDLAVLYPPSRNLIRFSLGRAKTFHPNHDKSRQLKTRGPSPKSYQRFAFSQLSYT